MAKTQTIHPVKDHAQVNNKTSYVFDFDQQWYKSEPYGLNLSGANLSVLINAQRGHLCGAHAAITAAAILQRKSIAGLSRAQDTATPLKAKTDGSQGSLSMWLWAGTTSSRFTTGRLGPPH
ncbi:hypothetical protein AVEN_246853-1 [Araneus ventricosus]|uniref:Uncharacterized protein n=1 Tax=Araneus ventricosus TaxID=182803 RepID=A0A4Y2L0M2_ARAVE|nr:hypothetical protein AVEN_246853-1 [Araneus ventricosus]